MLDNELAKAVQTSSEARYEAALSALRFVLRCGEEGQDLPEQAELEAAAREIVIERTDVGGSDLRPLSLDER